MVELTLTEVAEIAGGTLSGDGDAIVSGVESLEQSRARHLAFYLDSARRRPLLENCKAGCVIAAPGTAKPEKVGAMIYTDDPNGGFIKVCDRMLPHPRPLEPGIHQTAIVAATAKIDDSVHIGPYAVISDDVEIGPGSVVHAHCTVMEGVKIGRDTLLHPNCVIREFVSIGDKVRVQAGAVIGGDGFGYHLSDGEVKLIPQLGSVEMHDHVHVGANATVDRARFGKTLIKKGVKLDNLVQIGHKAELGMAVTIASMTAVGGSAIVGDFTFVSGGSGIADHIKVGAGANLLGCATVFADVEAGQTVYGTPARKNYFREITALARLPELLRRVKRLEKALEELRGEG